MPITALPALDRTSATFKTELDTLFLTSLPTFSTEAEAARLAIVASEVAAAASASAAATQAGLATTNGAAQVSLAAAQVALATTQANTATTQAGLSTAQAGLSSASANYKGVWSGLTGPLSMPASVSHASAFWALASNLSDVTAATPGVSGSWTLISPGSIPQNLRSAAYTLVLSDAGQHLLHPSADTTARTFTIPANASVAFPIGTALTFVNQSGAGVLSISITSDVMRLAGTGTTGTRTLAANGIATALKITATEWIINGTGVL